MQQLQPRREVWELGFLPLQALCPQLDGPQALLHMHAKLLDRSTCTPSGQCARAIALAGSTASGGQGAPGSDTRVLGPLCAQG